MDYLRLVMVVHFLWHLAATVGVFAAIKHSNDLHGRSWSKVALALGWLFLSVAILLSGDTHPACN